MVNIPTTQKAQVNEKGKLVFKDIPVPKPGKGEVLVKIEYSGVCHTDLHALNGDWPCTFNSDSLDPEIKLTLYSPSQ